jgi:hypothetical protein
MKVRPYKETSLWERAFSEQGACAYTDLRGDLARTYERFRERASDLTNEIHTLLPDLTVHNIEHLDALWDVASTIAGDNYPINPLEAFVLGGAILVHDAGMALAAFPERMVDIYKHARWKEHEAAAWRRRGFENMPTPERLNSPQKPQEMSKEVEREATFDILRAEHARKAQELLSMSWTKPGNKEPMFLLAEEQLRHSYGELIGLIAASHHWSVSELTKKLPSDPVSATHPYPSEWTIDAIKIACLLRCADAANIDETRAPSFVYALRRPGKISREHWEFQNRLLPGRPDGDALTFHSKKAFEERDAVAWWLCYETVRMCSEQLAQSDALLREMRRPPFLIRRVNGADAPPRLAETVRVQGWVPVDTTVKVTDVLGLVKSLGGIELYGDDPLVPLRELIQNAADAIRARRNMDLHFYRGEPEHRRGRITIRIENDAGPDAGADKSWLMVEDDGVGMSEWVMTGALLDFGTSLWRSSKVGEEFPGLVVGDDFQPTGRYGIGFYSVFMYADRVRVTSRPADLKSGGHGSVRTLEFTNGLARRALIRDYREEDGYLGSTVSTRVAVRLPRQIVAWWTEQHYRKVTNTQPKENVTPSLEQRLQRLVLGLDVVVELATSEAQAAELHGGTYVDLANDAFLYRLAMHNAGADREFDEWVQSCAARVTTIRDADRRVYGRGVAHSDDGWLSGHLQTITIGGLEAEFANEDPLAWRYGFCGILNGRPKSASRKSGIVWIPPAAEQAWATEQARLVETAHMPASERGLIAIVLSEHGGDVERITEFRVGADVVSLGVLVEKVTAWRRVLIPLSYRFDPDDGACYPGFRHHYTIDRVYEGQRMSAEVEWNDVILNDCVTIPVAAGTELHDQSERALFINPAKRIRRSLMKPNRKTLVDEFLEKLARNGHKFDFVTHDSAEVAKYNGVPLMLPALEIKIVT